MDGADAVRDAAHGRRPGHRNHPPGPGLGHPGRYKDPFLGRNLEAISPEPFQEAWWYRTEFQAGPAELKQHTRLLLDGVNYRADVWLNGRQIAGQDALYGAFRTFDLGITEHLRSGANALAILVHPPRKGDFSMGFVDWNPDPPDRNMGLFREVKLRRSGAVPSKTSTSAAT